ncbi:ATP-dependent zinc protease [Thiorhodococcus mannitoliphagus]|uniref:ATP-dependent zinc protease n=1 Tax=Thiorhodococcus mannitoliphagus TaxID=329406 RepID=A0A6P1E2W0_9GAMM|nr:ATP-dependent zinc protease [Thiorhodococcus mannitoliphagus]NEX22025.1 ATP-dependent zinc protease [Thiorhodococcus mannitoliphagus]
MTDECTQMQPCVLGWREWLALPELGLPRIKAKVDTGARTSTLHAFYVDTFHHKGQLHARFGVHPIQHRDDIVVHAEAAVIDRRNVSDSGGHREERYVIRTTLDLGGRQWPIELTLTNRESMLFRMLLGRTAIAGNALVDPAGSFVTGRVRCPWQAYGAGPSADPSD